MYEADRHDARHDHSQEAEPADPPEQHGHHDHGQQWLADRPYQGRVPDEQTGHRHGQDRGTVTPAQDDHRDGDQEDEQRVGGDHVLQVQFVGVEQHRQRGQRRAPPGQPAMAQQRVDGHADGDPHRRLEQPDRVVAVQREQEIQEERVAVRPDLVRDVRHRVLKVVIGVAEPEDGRIAEDHHDAHDDGGHDDQAELPVRHGRADEPRQQRCPLPRWRLLTGNDPLATGGRVGQRPPPDS